MLTNFSGRAEGPVRAAVGLWILRVKDLMKLRTQTLLQVLEFRVRV